MSPLKTALLVAALPLFTLTTLPSSAAPLMPTPTAKATLPLEQVQYRGGYRGGGHWHGGGGGGIAGAVIGGLAVGALIAGAAAANQEAQERHAYCAQRYRSYDPATGTFLARDGMRYPCQ